MGWRDGKVWERLFVLGFSLEGIGTTWHLTISSNVDAIATKWRARGVMVYVGIDG